MRRDYKPVSEKSLGLLNQKIISIVDELKRIGYSDRQAYKKTGELLNLAYPYLYTDPDPDLVRQRYTYHKKNRS